MLFKIGEMMKVRDCNGPRLLTITTGELLRCGATLTNCPIKGAYSNLWDEIGKIGHTIYRTVGATEFQKTAFPPGFCGPFANQF